MAVRPAATSSVTCRSTSAQSDIAFAAREDPSSVSVVDGRRDGGLPAPVPAAYRVGLRLPSGP
jgi:hypothetical protein